MTRPRRSRHLSAMGIPQWFLRSAAEGGPGPGAVEAARAAAASSPGEARPAARRPRGAGGAVEAQWDSLAAEVAACTLCALHETRTQTVFGVGRRDADLLIIGEAPGADEDRQGEPFVGRAGRLLNAMLGGIGLDRADVYIANILKCRPPGNRDPKPEESSLCTRYLDRQIGLIEPRVILAVGRIAAQWLLQSDQAIGRLRGRVLSYGESQIPLVVTYHPAYLLRNPIAKAKSWQDLCLVDDLMKSEA